jgi:hypothetical protein
MKLMRITFKKFKVFEIKVEKWEIAARVVNT